MQSYCVLIKDPDTEKQKILETLKYIHNFTEKQAFEYLKNNPGFISENVTYEKAQEILILAEKCQINVAVIETKNLPALKEPQIFKKAEVKSIGFTYFIESEGPPLTRIDEFIPFDKITLITAGVISEKEFPKSIQEIRKELTSQINSLYGQKNHLSVGVQFIEPEYTKTEPKTTLDIKEIMETNFYADIFFNKSPYHVRMKYDDFDYSYLGKRKSYSSLDNFRTFLDDISAIALISYKNKTTAALIKKQPVYPYKYLSISAYEKEILWLNTILSKKR